MCSSGVARGDDVGGAVVAEFVLARARRGWRRGPLLWLAPAFSVYYWSTAGRCVCGKLN